MPGTKPCFRFPLIWTFLVFFLSSLFRVGEAAVPGPVQFQHESFLEPPRWKLPGSVDFCLGIGNPSGISNKLHTLGHFPVGFWRLAETQASKQQQCSFQGTIQAMARRQDRHLRSVVGAPAPLRPGSSFAGIWTGVLCWGDCLIKEVPCPWPSGEYSSGRVLVTVARQGGLDLTTATVYCPPRGPTFPNAHALSEKLLVPITESVVFGQSGPRAILGDFNCEAGALHQMRLWKSLGWVELQDFMFQMHGVEPSPTCKHATSPDQMWISPELATMLANVAVWDIYPDHSVLIAGLKLPTKHRFEHQWRLPGHIPWDKVDLDRWSTLFRVVGPSPEGGNAPTGNPVDPTEAFRLWSGGFEEAVSTCVRDPIVRLDKSFYGRGKLDRPQPRLGSLDSSQTQSPR